MFRLVYFKCMLHMKHVNYFMFLANQMYVQSETVKSEDIRHKVWELDRWRPFVKLSEDLQKQVKRYQSSKWRETRGVDVEYLINNLPHYLTRRIKQTLCLDLLKRVEEFGNSSDALLEDLCDSVKPVFFSERSYIIREGDPMIICSSCCKASYGPKVPGA